MIIILEGPDCGGKSGLARRLLFTLDRRPRSPAPLSFHKGPPTVHPLDEYAAPLLTYRPGLGQHVVCDRWHVGESVYPDVVGRTTRLDAAVNAWLELFLLSRGALVVHVRRSNDYLRACGQHRGDPADVVEQVPLVTAAFDRALTSTLLPTVTLDGDDPTSDDLATIVGTAHDLEERVEASLREFVTYVGSPRPTVLLVGDRRGVAGDPTEHGDWPAFAPFPGTSGHYLLSTLTRVPLRVPTHGTLLSTIGLVNANDVDDVRSCWEHLGRPRVVALGVEARKTLRRLDVPVDNFAPHPQFWRRFRHHESDVYLRRLLGTGTREVVGA